MSKLTFKDLFNEIIYDWDYNYCLEKTSEGDFKVNKLYIEPTQAFYKTSVYKLEDGVFEKVQALYELLNGEK